jgi:cytochrome P450
MTTSEARMVTSAQDSQVSSAGAQELRTATTRESMRFWKNLVQDPLTAYDRVFAQFGDTVSLWMPPRRKFFVLSRPEYVNHVLVTANDKYVRAFTYKPLRALLGTGLLTSDGEPWARHRKVVQPVFTHRNIRSFGGEMATAVRRRVDGWDEDGLVDGMLEMRALTMDVVGRVLFGIELAHEAVKTGDAIAQVQRAAIVTSMLPLEDPKTTRRVLKVFPKISNGLSYLDQLVGGIIEERKGRPLEEKSRNMIDLLLGADNEHRLTEQEIFDEVVTMILAGHETTANALTWALVLLSQYPSARERLEQEVDEVLGGRDPEVADLEKLKWTDAVISEAMRLYPPGWGIEREAMADDEVGGIEIPAGSTVSMPVYLMHRHPEFWPNPEGFDPERFLEPRNSDRPKNSYIPFGVGKRVCIGAGFAMLEATLALATIANTHRLDLLGGTDLRPRADMSLRPRGEVPMRISRRPGR